MSHKQLEFHPSTSFGLTARVSSATRRQEFRPMPLWRLFGRLELQIFVRGLWHSLNMFKGLFVWQAWHLVTSNFILCGRHHGTYGTELGPVARLGPVVAVVTAAVCVAGVALGDIDLHFAWQAWHLWHWAGSGGALGSRCRRDRRGCLRGRRGTWRHRPSLCVAGVALSGGALGSRCRRGRRGCLRGRCGTW